ncbi:MAG: DUF6798 domain-containing protein [Thermoguttaceae bacterium]
MSRRQTILETLLIFAVFCLQGAWPVPEVNEPYYLGKAIHYWDPHWASSDWFLQTADTHAVFYSSVGWPALILKPTAFAWTVRLLTWGLLAWSWQRLSRAVVPQAWASVLTATLFVFLLQHYNMAGEWVIGGAEAKGFSFVLVFFALEAMVQGYWNRMWLLLGLASAFHILVGGWAALAAGVVWMMDRGRVGSDASAGNSSAASSPPKQPFCFMGRASCLIGPLVAFLLALPGLVPALLMNRGVDPAVAAEAHKIYVFERFPHHLDPAKFWADGFVLPFLWIVGLWLLLWPTASESPGAKRLRGFTAAAVVIALIGAAIGLLGLYHRPLATGWMRFYWFRLADVAVPLGLALLSVRWFVQRKMRVALMIVTAAAAFHAVDCAVLKLFSDPPFADRQVDGSAWRSACLWAIGQAEGPMFPRQPRADKLRNYSDWLDVCRWVSDPKHTSPDARFLIPRLASTFKWYSNRGEVVNWKETPQDAASLVAWWERIRDIYATGNQPPLERFYTSLAGAGAPKLQELAKKYEADYLVTQVSVLVLSLPEVYRNGSFVVYKLR